MRARPVPVLTAVTAALLLAGCGSDEPTAAPAPTTTSTAASTTSPTTTTTAAPATTTASAPAATTGRSAVPVPAAPTTAPPAPGADGGAPVQGQCLDVPPGPSDRYEVPGVGSAVVTFADGRLTLGEVLTESGWTSRVESSSGDDVGVEFRNGARVQDLEVELESGVAQGRVCGTDG